MNYENFLGLDWLNSSLPPLIITLVAIAIITLLNAKTLRQSIMLWRQQRLLNMIGIKQQKDLIYTDDLDGSFKVDRLVLLKDSIVVMSLKQYPGNIYCAEKIAEWTQVIDNKSFKFQNPLFELENQIRALQVVIPGIKIQGALFFDYTATFPKGHPDSVLHQWDIPESYFAHGDIADVAYPVLKAWETLVELSQSADSAEQLRLNT